MIEAVCVPESLPVHEPVNLELRMRCGQKLVAGDTIQVQFPNSWLMISGPSFTRTLQTTDPAADHYVKLECDGCRFEVEITPRHLNYPEGASRHGRLINATIVEGDIPAGRTIVLSYLNTMSSYVAEMETVWLRVKGEAPETAPTLTTTPGEAVALRVIAPSVVCPGEAFDVLIVSLDRFDNCSRTRYEAQTLSLEGGAVIADSLSFTGSVRIGVTLPQEGVCRFRLGDALSNAVQARQHGRLYWGDLHIHTRLSHDAMGADPYGYARDVSGLDFAAACDHVESLGDEGYEQLLEWAAAAYEPGRFVSVLADERIPPITGHHNMYFRCIERFLAEASREGKRDFIGELDPANVMVIPHHTGIAFGDMKHNQHGVDLAAWDDRDMRPVMEIYSHHGQSECYSPQHALAYEFNRMRNPERRSNTSIHGPHYAQDYWKAGYRLGVIASSDEHSGQGGRRHGGIAAVLADELTRESIFDSIRARSCYATTGERILMEFRVDQTPMGGELSVKKGRAVTVSLRVCGTELLLRVDILRYRFGVDADFAPVLSASPRPESLDAVFEVEETIECPCMYYARVVQEPLAWPGMAWSSPVWIDVE